MDRSQQHEQFSLAYARAIATVAGFSTYSPNVDDDSVDLGISERGGVGLFGSPRLELQLKCAYALTISETELRYAIKLKNYDDLRLITPFVPRILVVVVVPEKIEDWLDLGEERLLLRHGAYWLSLFGLPEVANEARVTVKIPRANLFTPAALGQMMKKVAQGLSP